VELDALRNLLRDGGGGHDAAAAVRRCSDAELALAVVRPAIRSISRRRCFTHPRSEYLIAATAPCTAGNPGPAAAAHEHSMTLHGGETSPMGTGREWARFVTLRRADVALCRAVCRREARSVTTHAAGLPPCTGPMVAAPCSGHPGGHGPRRCRQEPQPRAAPQETKPEPAQTAGITRVLAADSCRASRELGLRLSSKAPRCARDLGRGRASCRMRRTCRGDDLRRLCHVASAPLVAFGGASCVVMRTMSATYLAPMDFGRPRPGASFSIPMSRSVANRGASGSRVGS
jgi:hypothetical protein